MSAQGTAHIEYWFDADYAHATSVAASYGTTSLSPDVSQLSAGLHQLTFHYVDSNGNWSVPQSTLFLCTNRNYSGTWRCEYWFDSDDAHPISVPTSYGVVNISADVSQLSTGLHKVTFHFEDSNGNWSVPRSTLFMCNNYKGTDTGTWCCEYWFDTNYDQKKTIKTGGRVFIIEEDVAQLREGIHQFCYRIQDTQGRWSGTRTTTFLKPVGGLEENNLITAYQYWFDEDDAQAETVELTDPALPYLLNVDLDVSDLTDEITPDNLAVVKDEFGFNQIGRATDLRIRFKDKSRAWSNVQTYPFVNMIENPLLNGFIKNPEADEGMTYWDGAFDISDSDGDIDDDEQLAPVVSKVSSLGAATEENLFRLSEGGWMSQTIEGLPFMGLRLTFWASVDEGGEMKLNVGDRTFTITSSTWQSYHVDFLPDDEGVFTINCEAISRNAKIDHFVLTLPIDETPMDEADFALLKRFYNEMGGDNWTHKWNFAETAAATGRLNGVKTRNGRVVRVSLPDNNLKGTLNTTLFALSELTEVNLRGNQLSGDMATWMEALRQTGIKSTHLRHLDISDNVITGNLGAIGDAFPELVSLRASGCHLTDVIPALPAHITRLDIGGQSFDRTFTFSELTAGGILKESVPTILLYDHATRGYRSTLPLTLAGSDNATTWRAHLDVYDSGTRIYSLNSNEAVNYLSVGTMLQATYKDFIMPVEFDFLMGDVDFNSYISVGDLQKTINLSLERYVPFYNHTAANIVADDVINVQDVAALVTTMLTPKTMAHSPRFNFDYMADDDTEAQAEVYMADGCLMLNSTIPVAAFDVNLAGGSDDWEWLLDNQGIQCSVTHDAGSTHLIGYSILGNELASGLTAVAKSGRLQVTSAELVDTEGNSIATSINGVPTSIMAATKGVSLMAGDGMLRLCTDDILHDLEWQVLSLSGQVIAQGHTATVAPGSTTLCPLVGQPVVVRLIAGNTVLTKKISTK